MTQPQPWVIPAGETKTIPSGKTRIVESVKINGTLKVNGTLKFGQWSIGGTYARVNSVSVTPETLTLSFYEKRDEMNKWRQYGDLESTDVTRGYAGRFRAFNRGTQTPVVVDPKYQPPLTRMQYFVTSYTEEELSADWFSVELTLQRIRNRSNDFGSSNETGDWEFEFSEGTIGLDVYDVSSVQRQGTSYNAQTSLTLDLTADQAGTVLGSARFPGGVVSRDIPDGNSRLHDETNGNQQVTITSPSYDFNDGTYFIRGYEITQNTTDWTCKIEVTEK